MLKLHAGVKGLFFGAVVVEILAELDGQMCEKHCKYLCFLKVPHFLISWYFGVLRSTFGRRFGSFLEAWGSKTVILGDLGDRLKF